MWIFTFNIIYECGHWNDDLFPLGGVNALWVKEMGVSSRAKPGHSHPLSPPRSPASCLSRPGVSSASTLLSCSAPSLRHQHHTASHTSPAALAAARGRPAQGEPVVLQHLCQRLSAGCSDLVDLFCKFFFFFLFQREGFMDSFGFGFSSVLFGMGWWLLLVFLCGSCGVQASVLVEVGMRLMGKGDRDHSGSWCWGLKG